jgi:TRAP-type C4-dicarboxylate transport system permease small subunit
MDKIVRIVEQINCLGVWIGGGLLFLTSGMIAVEVVLRKVFSISMGGADELSSYVLAISCSWAFGFALLRKAHIRIDIFYSRMSPRVRSLLDILSLAVFMVYLTPLVYFASLVVKTSLIRNSAANTPLHTPLWIPQGIWFLGLVLFFFTTLILLVAAVTKLISRDLSGLNRLAGATTLEEEIEEESGIQIHESHQGG